MLVASSGHQVSCYTTVGGFALNLPIDSSGTIFNKLFISRIP